VFHSACYAFLSKWQLALEDALICVAKDPNFFNGYFRLSSACIELQKYEDADITINAALKIDPGKYLTKIKSGFPRYCRLLFR
jgi:tetratricopeptide (TPR) repeat protein